MAFPNIAIIDFGAGNLHSVRKAIVSQLPEGATVSVVTDAAALAQATHIVLPGVGAFADCMRGLEALPGMRAALETAVLTRGKPFLGICVGMQMLFERGHEHGVHEGLGWFKGEVREIAPSDPNLRIPHMGWNKLKLKHKEHPVLRGVADGDFAYFVHSYAATGCNPKEVLATVDYGGEIVALIGRDNLVATQFHPEKSQATGLQMIRNFLNR
ncbi:MAG: imidazole glycerol phosphate synthase subunit HisH [Alphaproteobacteria bacterium]|nr:imidazole glycerol phosphate synthase subunit HisH [Alphaproteobacteria bacterium]